MLIWIALGAVIGYGLLRVFAGHLVVGSSYQTLSPREVATIRAASDAMYPGGGAIPPSGSEAGIPAYTDRYLAVLPGQLRVLTRMLFFLVEHATLFFPAPGRTGFRRFSSLSGEQRAAVLEGWRTSRLFPRRLVFTSLRAILTMGYFADPAVARRLGLAPYAIEPPVCEADLLYPRIGEHPDAIQLTRGDLTPPSDGTPIPLDGPLHPRFAEKESS
jgi:hypothetical protein